MPTPAANARDCLRVLGRDLPYLQKYDNYVKGFQDDPYTPESADGEFRLLAQRCKTNVCDFILSTSMQPLAIDDYRPTKESHDGACKAAFRHFQRSRLDGRQPSLYRAAGTFGHAFTVTERDAKGRTSTRALSSLRTSAIYENPASDDNAVFAVTVTEWPSVVKKDGKSQEQRGKAIGWDRKNVYDITFKDLGVVGDGRTVSVRQRAKPHGLDGENPVTRFAVQVDLEGNTMGLIAPQVPLQDRLNQSVFDLLVTQTYASFKVRTITGMAPPLQQEEILDQDGNGTGKYRPKLGPDGNPMPANINLSQKRFLFAESDETRFGTLDETPLDGFINSINMSMRQMAALSQTPPHHMLGEIANLSAEALQAAEQALMRKIGEIQAAFGESWERVFRLAARLEGFETPDDDDNMVGEVIWRNANDASLAQAGDFLGKAAVDLQIPVQGLWHRIPGVTKQEIELWKSLADANDEQAQMLEAIRRTRNSPRPRFRDGEQAPTDEPAKAGVP